LFSLVVVARSLRAVAVVVFLASDATAAPALCGCLALDRCLLANPDDRAAGGGPGPRYWIGDPRPAV
jgi:hypothetical protein